MESLVISALSGAVGAVLAAIIQPVITQWFIAKGPDVFRRFEQEIYIMSNSFWHAFLGILYASGLTLMIVAAVLPNVALIVAGHYEMIYSQWAGWDFYIGVIMVFVAEFLRRRDSLKHQ